MALPLEVLDFLVVCRGVAILRRWWMHAVVASSRVFVHFGRHYHHGCRVNGALEWQRVPCQRGAQRDDDRGQDAHERESERRSRQAEVHWTQDHFG